MSKMNTLKAEFGQITEAIDNIERAASDRGADLTDAEQTDVDALYSRAADLKPQIEAEAAKLDNLSAVSAIVAKHGNAPVARAAVANHEEITAGEFLSNALKVQAGQMAKEEHIARAAKYLRAGQVTADTVGILPEPIVGNIIELFDASRPVFASFSARPMPASGKSFIRPEVTQHVVTGDQTPELSEVASQKMILIGNQVDKFTEAGFLDLSQQDVDWTDPSAMQLVVQDFVKAYNRRMEVRASEYLAALATTSAGYDTATIGAAVGSFVDAFATVDANAEEAADTIWLDSGSWADLAKITNSTTDESALTLINNALSTYGVSPRWVVGRQLEAGTVIVGSSRLVESYEDNKGLLRAAQPDVLGQRLAYFGYGAFHGTEEGFVSLETA
jgi:HK97 family phage major capsid protein